MDINTFISWFKTPWVIAIVIGGVCYYINSQNFITKDNMKDKITLRSQRINAIKGSIKLMIVVMAILYAYKYLGDPTEAQYQYAGGLPPF